MFVGRSREFNDFCEKTQKSFLLYLPCDNIIDTETNQKGEIAVDMDKALQSESATVLVGKTDRNDKSLWLPLWIHLKDTAQVMDYLVRYWLPTSVQNSIGLGLEQLLKTARFLGLVHDIGKATCLFQYRIVESLPESGERLKEYFSLPRRFADVSETPHALASEVILLQLGCPPGLASIAGAHHGKPQGYDVDTQLLYCPQNYWGQQEAEWRGLWKELFAWALRESDIQNITELPQLTTSAQLLFTGLLTMADWIASNTQYFPLLPIEEQGGDALYPARSEEAWRKLNLSAPWESEYVSMDEETFKGEFKFPPNAIQRSVLDAVQTAEKPGLLILEAQMGIGKTEAALAAAQILAKRRGSGGIFFGLPTQATANGIFDRLEAWAETQSEDTAHSIRLAHGMAMLNEDYRALFDGHAALDDETEGGVFVHSWFQGNKQALLSDFVIGTVDQLLMAALKQKHVMMRHLGLAGKVVIVDECHAYDTYMNGYLDRALSWLGTYHVPVILLSATLPAKRRAELVVAYQNRHAAQYHAPWCANRGYPLLTWTDGDGISQKVVENSDEPHTVQVSRITDAELSELLAAKLCGGCAGVIVNTVRKAQNLASQLREALPKYEIFLYHAQFLMPDRAEKERELLCRLGKTSSLQQRERFIVIGTQVLEQSLDIDFDFLVTELCPMDLLLQRIGRLHRHAQRERPLLLQTACCAVLDTGSDDFDSGSSTVYGEWLLWRTRQLLPEAIELPTDIPALVQDVYGWEQKDVLEPTAYSRKIQADYELRQCQMAQKAALYQIHPPEPDEADALQDEYELNPTMDGWLEDEMEATDVAARAAVRDGAPSIEVLVMVQRADGSVHFLPWQEGGAAVSPCEIPSAEESLKIARQRLRLPGRFSRPWIANQAIRELEDQNRTLLPLWQQAPMLKGELVLLLNESFAAKLAGFTIRYDRQLGLTCEKEEDDARNGI